MRQLAQPQKTSAPILKILIFSLIFALVTFALIKLLNLDRYVFKGPKTVVQLITDTGLKSDMGRVNVLLLGTGGAGHEGPDLTDTIIFASVDKKGKDAAFVSIPRDLWAPNLGAKINSAYAYGQEQEKGIEAARKTVELLFEMPVHYIIRVDFGGFIKAVDLVGGLNIDVERTFTDPRYPITGREDDLCGLTLQTQEIEGVEVEVVKDATGSAIPLAQITDKNDPFTCRYEALTFGRGPTLMDGETALKFVRSRQGTNNEGSDFARSARQQKAVLVFREKVFSSETLTDPNTIIDLIKTFGQSIDTNIDDEEIPLFIKLATKIDPSTIRQVVLDSDREESILEVGRPENHGGQFVLVPRGNLYSELAEYVQGEIFKLEEQ